MSETNESLARWEPILPCLRDFQQSLSEKVSPLRIVAANDRTWSQEQYRKLAVPLLNKCGVYLIFDDASVLQYVGVAMYTFHKRVWSHDEQFPRRWTDIIAFEPQYAFLALSLEYYLICKLKPPGNSVYKGYEIVEM